MSLFIELFAHEKTGRWRTKAQEVPLDPQLHLPIYWDLYHKLFLESAFSVLNRPWYSLCTNHALRRVYRGLEYLFCRVSNKSSPNLWTWARNYMSCRWAKDQDAVLQLRIPHITIHGLHSYRYGSLFCCTWLPKIKTLNVASLLFAFV